MFLEPFPEHFYDDFLLATGGLAVDVPLSRSTLQHFQKRRLYILLLGPFRTHGFSLYQPVKHNREFGFRFGVFVSD